MKITTFITIFLSPKDAHHGWHHWALPTRFQGKLQAFQGRKCRLTQHTNSTRPRGDSASQMEIECHEISDFAREIEDYINHIKPNL